MMMAKRHILWLILFLDALSHRACSFTTSPHVPRKQLPQRVSQLPPIDRAATKRPSIRTRIIQAQTRNDNEKAFFSTPLDRPLLALVDMVALLVFAGIGKASHAPDGSLDLLAVATVAFPFALSWFITSPITGVYDAPDDYERKGNVVQDAFIKAGKGWIVGVPLGCVLRSVIKGYAAPLPFVVVTMIATLVLLGGARALFAILEDFFGN